MTLTVPSAGTNPGRAARAQGSEPGNQGQLIEQLGQRMTQVGTMLETDRVNREFQRLTTDLTRDVNDLRLEIEEVGDPDQADAAWQAGVERIRAAYAGVDEQTNRARVDPKNADRFGIQFDRMVNAASFQLGRRSLGLRNAQREAQYIEYSHEAGRAAATSDPEMRDELIAQGDDQIAALVRSGVIDEAEAERRRQRLRGDVSTARAITMVNDNPEGFVGELDAGGFAGLSAPEAARYRAQASRAAQAKQEAAAREAQARIDSDLRDLRDVLSAGRFAQNEDLLQRPEYQASEEYAETRVAFDLRNEGLTLDTATPAQLREAISKERNKKLSKGYEAKRLPVLERWLDRHEEGYAKDPISYARSVGFDIEALPEFEPQNPQSYIQAIERRVQSGQSLAELGYAPDARVFSNDELQQLRSALAVEEDPEKRAGMAAALNQALRGSGTSLSDVAENPVLSHVGGLVEATGANTLGAEILRGQQAIAEENVVLPPLRDRRDSAFAVVDEIFADLPAGEALQSTSVAAADALYARRVGRIDPAGDIDDVRYRQALHEVMGGTGQYNSASARGGIQEVRGAQTLMPQGIAAEKVESTLEDLGIGRTKAAISNRMEDTFDADLLAKQLAAASGGQVPDIAGAMPNRRTLDDMTVQAVGDDIYVFVRKGIDGETPQVLQNDQGGPFTFSLTRLMREVGK